ncbi:hypothetical protein [Methanoculleus taiwanensis]|uniref:hypothetical protein n=1 Tax=Methanoculleus taiwanensis TaxID=1550565 RepID=UPI0013E8D5B2|nr:hypothetical protein [Methanoculleus taiwanensis]
MNRLLRSLIYGAVALAVYSGISFWFSGRVNWVLAAATAIGIMLGSYFIVRHPET